MKKLVIFFTIFILLVSVGNLVSYGADRPLDGFCAEVGMTGDICTQDYQDKSEGDGDLLSKDGIVKRTFDLMSWLTGLLAGVFIVVGAFRLITSGGNKDTIKSARNTVVYAAIGLAVIILSNLIINFVIGLSNEANS
jgi:hypothetical protein